MTAIYEDVTITWQGHDYVIKPTYQMINRIEAQGVSVTSVANRTMKGDPPISHIAMIVAFMLRSAGAGVTPEDVYAHFMTSGDLDQVSNLALLVSTAFFPRVNAPGNQTAPATGQ
jgi:hypothetical protein